MRSTVAAASRSLVLIGAIGAGWLLAAELLPAHVQASSSSTDPSSEWTTTHSDEPSAAPPAAAGAKSTSKNGTVTRSQTSRKRSATQAKGGGSEGEQASRKSGQGTSKDAKPEPIGIQLEKLFRGIGADLEEFFVGTRTVDKD